MELTVYSYPRNQCPMVCSLISYTAEVLTLLGINKALNKQSTYPLQRCTWKETTISNSYARILCLASEVHRDGWQGFLHRELTKGCERNA